VQQMIPVALMLSASVALGLWLGWQFLRRSRSNPIHIGFHLILGVVGLEAVAMLMRGAPDGTITQSGSYGKLAALVLALAIITGFATALVLQRWCYSAGRAPAPALRWSPMVFWEPLDLRCFWLGSSTWNDSQSGAAPDSQHRVEAHPAPSIGNK